MTAAAVAAVQFEPEIGAVEANLGRIERFAADLEAAVAVFPELAVTGYHLPTVREAATTVPGPTTDRLVEIAATTGTDLVVGLPESDDGALFNDLVYVGSDGVRGVYRKQYLWGDERTVFEPGEGPVTVDSPVGRLGMLLCWDLNLPETSLAYADRACDVLAVSAAWRTSFLSDWRLLSRARALDGTCYVVGSNHVGDQTGREHGGHSLVADPSGTIVAEANDAAGSVVHPVDPATIAAAQERNPVLRSRSERR